MDPGSIGLSRKRWCTEFWAVQTDLARVPETVVPLMWPQTVFRFRPRCRAITEIVQPCF
jgi:hypothetical protein